MGYLFLRILERPLQPVVTEYLYRSAMDSSDKDLHGGIFDERIREAQAQTIGNEA